MNKKTFEEVELKTGVDPLFFAETMTTDVELIDAIFDLIDNSIDAARGSILLDTQHKTDEYGLPSDYSGYEIDIEFFLDKISITDNCLGIESNDIENTAFYTGKKSNHDFGIGYYGLGLKRALLKAGKLFELRSDNGVDLYTAEFGHEALSGDKNQILKAKKSSSEGLLGTTFSSKNLKPDVVNQITSKDWFDDAVKHLSIRYSIFLKKGLKISFQSHCFSEEKQVSIKPKLPNIREDGPVPGFPYRLPTDKVSTDQVHVYFNVGVHEGYKFPGEIGHDAKANKELTKEFGIYFICNDRVIVSNSFEKKYGFNTSLHSEYNGFLCYVRMVSKSPSLLPWNTAKTEIKVHNPLFIEARKPIESLAKRYRTEAKKVINVWLSPELKSLPDSLRREAFYSKLNLKGATASPSIKPPVSAQTELPGMAGPSPRLKSPPGNSRGAGKNKELHTSGWKTLLPAHFPTSSSDNNVLNNMLVEAASLYVESASHASCLLYRSLLEASLKSYVKKSNSFEEVITYYYEVGEGKKNNHSEEYKKQQGITLNMCLLWLLANKNIFPRDDEKVLTQATKDARKHVKKMNGVVHCLSVISDTEVLNIRNETISLLEFLVTLGEPSV